MFVMPGLVPGIHVFLNVESLKTWMAGDKPGHDDAATVMLIISATRPIALRSINSRIAWA